MKVQHLVSMSIAAFSLISVGLAIAGAVTRTAEASVTERPHVGGLVSEEGPNADSASVGQELTRVAQAVPAHAQIGSQSYQVVGRCTTTEGRIMGTETGCSRPNLCASSNDGEGPFCVAIPNQVWQNADAEFMALTGHCRWNAEFLAFGIYAALADDVDLSFINHTYCARKDTESSCVEDTRTRSRPDLSFCSWVP